MAELPREGFIQHIGNATVLLRVGAFTVLTDPNFLHRGDHVHLGYGLHATRLTDPAIELDALPPLDFVLLSHLHEDHFDREVARRLSRQVPIVTTARAARALRRMGFSRARSLETWESLHLEKEGVVLRVTATPAQHGPPLVHRLLPPVMGSVLDFRDGRGERLWRVYVSGDTLPVEALADIPKRFPDIDLALLHLGGTSVLGIIVTMTGAQGVEAMRMIDARESVPIHFDDYSVFTSGLDDFKRAVDAAGLGGRVRYLERGRTYAFALAGAATPVPELHPQ